MGKKLELEIPLLLPELEDVKDDCVDRLVLRVSDVRGVEKAHVIQDGERLQLCLHFDPNFVSIDRIKRMAKLAGAEVSKRFRHQTFFIRDMDCADCAATIEHLVGRAKGVLSVSVSYATETMIVEYDTNLIQFREILERIRGAGYRAEEQGEKTESWLGRHRGLALALLAGICLAGGYFGQFLGLHYYGILSLYFAAYLTAGFDVARHGIRAALKFRVDIDFLMVVAATGAAVVGEWAEGAFLLFLFSLGHALEHYATDRARKAIEALGKITPQTARVRRDGLELEIPVEQLRRGDTVIVRESERFPIDGEVLEGDSAVDQSPITGESVPVEKTAGDQVFAGTINGEAALEVRVTKLAKDSTLARVLKMVEEAQTQKSPTQRFAEKFATVFVPVVLIITVVTIFVPPIAGWLSWKAAFLRAMAVLVGASPCALAIATPAAVLSAVAQAARNGILIKGGGHLENLGSIRALALDKTGTITRGEPEVVEVVSFETSEEELLATTAAIESRSKHPLARAIMREADKRNLMLPEPEDVKAVAGRGVRGRIDGENVLMGNLRLFEDDENVTTEIADLLEQMEERGRTSILVKKGERFVGIIGLADQPRENAASSFERLKTLGISSLIMITGDNERVARSIAGQVGITRVRAGLLPEGKVEVIKELREEFQEVAMVGDGVNDAPAMKTATVGIAMGASGTDVALESADIALMADDLSKLPVAIGLSRQSRSIIRQNLFISLGVILVLVPAALFGLAGIGIAIVLHEGSTLLVVANALRLLGFSIDRREDSS